MWHPRQALTSRMGRTPSLFSRPEESQNYSRYCDKSKGRAYKHGSTNSQPAARVWKQGSCKQTLLPTTAVLVSMQVGQTRKPLQSNQSAPNQRRLLHQPFNAAPGAEIERSHDRGAFVAELEQTNQDECVSRKKLIPKVLRHHHAADAAVHDPDANAPKFGSQDVGAMSRRVH